MPDLDHLLPGMSSDDVEAHARAYRTWFAHDCAVPYGPLVAIYRQRIAVERAAGVHPVHPNGEDGRRVEVEVAKAGWAAWYIVAVVAGVAVAVWFA